jgi:hypothetical protein
MLLPAIRLRRNPVHAAPAAPGRLCLGRPLRRLCGAASLLLCAILAAPANAAPETAPATQEPTRSKRVLVAPVPPRKPSPGEAAEVHFMRQVMTTENPTLETEDPRCVERLPVALLRETAEHGLD